MDIDDFGTRLLVAFTVYCLMALFAAWLFGLAVGAVFRYLMQRIKGMLL